MKNKKLLFLAPVAVVFFVFFLPEKEVDFSREVKPILNKHCISCHGGVKKNGGFSVLFEEEALAATESGRPAIIPGDARHSEFIRRLTSDDPDERMPYNAAPLAKKEIDILKRWVKQGAKWGQHWAYSLPERVEIPRKDDGLTGVDYFIREKHREKGVSFSPAADTITLLRRLYLDVTGLPPTPEDVRTFLADKGEDAYERRVDSLLASPRFGEKWASWWLDMARYADSKGYEADLTRQIWPYRDWVIRAFNADKPFDEFTIEQLAGDLLPAPTRDQLIATAFHRNTMTNDEGGTDNEEFRVSAVIDRINTTWQVWQSTTFECVQCHSHTYDPFRQKEYYRFMAFFNNTRDEDTVEEYPKLRFYEEEDSTRVAAILDWVAARSESEVSSAEKFMKVLEPKINAYYADEIQNGAFSAVRWLALRHGGSARLRDIRMDDRNCFYFRYTVSSPGGTLEVRLDSIQGQVIAKTTLSVTKGLQVGVVPVSPVAGRRNLYLVVKNPRLPADKEAVRIEWIAFRKSLPGMGEPGYEQVEKAHLELLSKSTPAVPIMTENPPDMHRVTQVFERGNWLVHGEKVEPDVPEALHDFPSDAPRNRLGLARWLVSRDNPLTARTIVNRFWEQVFGRGLVETLEDMGTQGSEPTHPELLDWLALRFMNEMNWSMKSLVKELVLSRTYRQSSRTNGELLAKDPANRYYARGPRFRLPAEQVRDQVLAVSGLLSTKMYGPSVKPYQPDGIWMAAYSSERWVQSEGEDAYRRGVYTFLKRTSPYPSFMTFDASSREVCTVQRIRTNTPLQALVTLNDPVYMEAATALAEHMEKLGGEDVRKAISTGYQQAMLRKIPEEKLKVFEQLYKNAYAEYRADFPAAVKLLRKEGTEYHPSLVRLAAYTIVANTILNLDEFLTKL